MIASNCQIEEHEESLVLGASAGLCMDRRRYSEKWISSAATNILKCNTRPHIALYFTNHTLTGHSTASRARPNRMPQKVCAHRFMIHSAMAAAKSILSPMRCLTSLSHARGLVP